MTRHMRNIVYYIVSFDLIDPHSHNYDKILEQVNEHFATRSVCSKVVKHYILNNE